MITGLGVDIVEIDRMRAALERRPRMKERLFSAEERRYCDKRTQPEVHYALRFAAKEAVLKALGTGFAGMRFTRRRGRARDVGPTGAASARPCCRARRGARRRRDAPVALVHAHDGGGLGGRHHRGQRVRARTRARSEGGARRARSRRRARCSTRSGERGARRPEAVAAKTEPTQAAQDAACERGRDATGHSPRSSRARSSSARSPPSAASRSPS